MRVVFMGTPEFADAALKRLYQDNFDIAAVLTQPDKLKNRGLRSSISPVKATAQSHGTRVLQPDLLRDPHVAALLSDINPDVIAVVAYGKILPPEILTISKYGCVNIHGSLLPKYRGAAPIQHAVLNGERTTGVTAMYLSEGMDTGDIIDIASTHIGDNETAGELYSRLAVMGAQLLSKTLTAIVGGTAARVPQNDSEASYAPPLSKEMSPINWNNLAKTVCCHIRGLNPWPVATAEIGGNPLKVYAAERTGNVAVKEPGSVVSSGKRGIEVACVDFSIMLTEVQAAGGKRMSASEYLRGHPL